MNKQRNAWFPFFLAVVFALGCAVTFARHHHAKPSQGSPPGQFDYYVLTMSWSPTYCLTHPQDHNQCSGKGYGFVLHGLCNSLFPSPNLVEHEWQRHGTCSGLDAISYFRTADKALASVHVPKNFEAPRNSLSMTGLQILSAFHDANPSIPGDGMIVACGRGELSEVRICLTRGLAPRACGKGMRSSCPASPVDIPATRGQ